MWGFDHFTGPAVALQVTPGTDWRLAPPTASSGAASPAELIAGQPNHLQLLSTGTSCVQSIALEPGDAHVDWKLASAPPVSTPASLPNTPPPVPAAIVRPLDLTLNLQHAATPGSLQLAIQQFGQKAPDHLGTRTFAEPARIASLQLHAGDTALDLNGTSLDQVKSLTLTLAKETLTFTPVSCPETPSTSPDPACTSPNTRITLQLPPSVKSPALKPNEHITADVHLADGRTLDVHATALPPRPTLTLIATHITEPATPAIQLGSRTDLPLGAQLTFFLKSPTPFPRTEQVEIANQDGSLHTTLSIAAGSLILEDAHTVLATFDPLKTFGPSTFGPIRLRAIAPDGTPGAWLPLASIVRLPTLTALRCPTLAAAPCTLSGSSLYLIDSVSTSPDFAISATVPDGFVDSTFEVPHPANAAPASVSGAAPAPTLYIRLRDNPASVDQITLPVQTDPPPTHSTLHPKASAPSSIQSSFAR